MKSQDKLVSLSKHPFGNQGCFKSELKTPLPVKADRDLDRTHWLCKDWNRTGQSLALIPEGLETRMEWGNTWISLVVSVSHTGVLYVTNAHLGKPEDQSLVLEPVLREEKYRIHTSRHWGLPVPPALTTSSAGRGRHFTVDMRTVGH